MHYASDAASMMSVLIFFFQAEDGIRDHCVTGVQTCALPISPAELPACPPPEPAPPACPPPEAPPPCPMARSEERRVGKECRSRWTPVRRKKNKRMHGTDIERDVTATHTARWYIKGRRRIERK